MYLTIKKDLNKEKISAIKVCMLVFFLTNLSYLPFFVTNGWTQYLSYPTWGLLIMTLLFTHSYNFKRTDLTYILAIMAVAVFWILSFWFTEKSYLSSLLTKCIILAIVIAYLGRSVANAEKTVNQENKLFYSYIFSSFILSLVVYFIYLKGQNIASTIYVYASKNEVAFLDMTSIILLLYTPLSIGTGKTKGNIVRVVLLAFFIFIMFSLRCRSMLVALIFVLAYYTLIKNKSKAVRVLTIAVGTSLIIALQNASVYNVLINGVLFAGRDSGSLDSLTSGRMTQIVVGWAKFIQNFWVGTGDTKTVDCFFISVLMQYGVFVGLLFICFAFKPLITGLKYISHSPNYQNIKTILILCSICYLIGGIFEENAPFGPGVRCYLMWFLFGYLSNVNRVKTSNLLEISELQGV